MSSTILLLALPVAVVARPGALHPSRVAPAARRFAFGRVPSRAASLLPGRPAPAWTYLSAPLNSSSSTALRARRRTAAPVPG